MRKYLELALSSAVILIAAVALLFSGSAQAFVVPGPAQAPVTVTQIDFDDTTDVIDTDTTTLGDWRGVYGDCFVLLPDPQCTGFPEPLFGEMFGDVCTRGLQGVVAEFDLRRGDDLPARTFWNTFNDCSVINECVLDPTLPECSEGGLCGTVEDQLNPDGVTSTCGRDFSMCEGSEQWNPCADSFKGTLWDEGDCITPGDVVPPLVAEMTLNLEGSTELAYYFAAGCESERVQDWRLYIDNSLLPVKSGVITVTGDGQYLAFQLDDVVPGTVVRLETENQIQPDCDKKANNSVLSGIFLSDCVGPCPEVKVSKTCEILPPPPGPGVSTCDDLKDVTALILIWDGPDGVNIQSEIGQVITGINQGDVIVLEAPKDQTGNDVDLTITGMVTGTSRFHISCSDQEMNGFEDCGSAQGNGKDNKSGLNYWLFGGMIGEKGQFTCPDALPDPDGFPTETEECVFTPQPPGGDCDDIKDITALTLVWNGLEGVDIQSEVGQVINDIQNGDVIVLDTPKDQTGNDVEVTIFNNATGAPIGMSEFHISCSDDDMDGPEDCGSAQGNGKDDESGLNNQWLLGGMSGENGQFGCAGVPGPSDSAEVIYGIRVENLEDLPVEVRIVDDKLGIEETVILAGNGTHEIVTEPFVVTPDHTNEFTNTVVVTVDDDPTCGDSDSVVVRRNPPPPPPVSCSDIKDITAVSVIWTGPGPIDVATTGGQMFEDVQTGNKITFNTPDKDTELFISGAVNGTSNVHVSCSDEDMNGSEDCGKAAGNGKSNDSGLINLWLFDGMIGEKGSFDCGLPNTGVVTNPGSSGGPGGGYVTGAATLDLGDDKKVKWELTNNGTQDAFVKRVVVTWPGQHRMVKKFKLEGDFAKDVFDATSPTAVPDEKAFESDRNKRKLKKGDHKKLEIEFTEKYKYHSQSDFTIEVEFENGQTLSFP